MRRLHAPRTSLAVMPVMAAIAGPLLMHHIFALLAAGLVLSVLTGSGLRALRVLSPEEAGPSATLTLTVALGLGITSAAMLGVAVVLGPSAWTLWGGLLLLGLWARRELARLPHLVRAAFQECYTPCPPGLTRRLGLSLVAAIALTCLCLALVPPTGYDGLAYHLQVPRQWLAYGKVFLPEDNYHTAFIGVNQVLYLPLLAAGVPSATQVLNAMQALLLGLGVFTLGKQVGGPVVGALSPLILYSSPIVLVTGVLPMVDVPLTLVLVAATLAVVEALDTPADRRCLLLVGVLLGVAFGVKYLALIYAIALAPIGIVAVHRSASGSPTRAAGLVARTGLCFLLGASPWIAKNMVMFGNPVFPLFSTPQVEPWLKPLYPDLQPRGVDATLFTVHQQMRRPVTLRGLFLQPASLEPDVDGSDSAPYLPLLLAPLAFILPRRRGLALVLVPVMVYIVLLLAYSRYTSIRYLIPALPGLSIGLAALCAALLEHLSGLIRPFVVATLLVLALPTPLALVTRLRWKQAIPHAMGLVSDEAVLRGYWDTSDYMDVVHWTDTHVARGNPAILLFEARGFYFKSEVREDLLLRNWAYLAPFADAPGCLAATKARFIILNTDGLHYFLSRGVRPSSLGWESFPIFHDRCLSRRYRNNKFIVYEVMRH